MTIPVVDQTTMNQMPLTNMASSSIYPNVAIGEIFDASLIDDSGDGIWGALHIGLLNLMVPPISTFDNLTTASAASVNTPTTATFADPPATAVLVNAPSPETSVEYPATIAVPSVGVGTGKKTGTMRPNPHSTTAQ